jgi:hypothetical protein
LGFEVIERFSTTPDSTYVACRDLRHERPAVIFRSKAVNSKKRERLQQFERLVNQAQSQQIGAATQIPKSTRRKLSTFFSQISLEKMTIHQSRAISKGCFNDCLRIFCSPEEPIHLWVDPKTKTVAATLLHQVAHAERCEIQGGRVRYITNWLRELPEAVLDDLEQGLPFDASLIEYAGYIEAHAKNRTESVCRMMTCSGSYY